MNVELPITADPNHLKACLDSEIIEEYMQDGELFHKHMKSYFPHLEGNIKACVFEYDWVWGGIRNNATDTYKQSDADKQIKKIKKAILDLSQLDLGYYMPMCVKMNFSKSVKETNELMESIHDFIGELDEVGLETTQDALEEYETVYWESLNTIPRRKNINWQAVDAVYRLTGLWWRNTGLKAPQRALNPESTFANFLRDGFAVFKIEGDPISAFRRYVKLRDEGYY